MTEIKQEVQQFYDSVGWKLVGEDIYQNARYEDLRPVSSEYIHRCHLRVARYLRKNGEYLLDAGSGPVQYPDYLAYSKGYQYRVCADISITALQEARNRLGDHGLYVVCDVANLPFETGIFEGVVSLHTIHHLPENEHLEAYSEIHRVLAANSQAAVVNGWPDSRLMNFFEPFVRFAQRLRHYLDKRTNLEETQNDLKPSSQNPQKKNKQPPNKKSSPKGTFTSRHDVPWIKNKVGALMAVDIFVWRSVSVRFLRALIHPSLGGRFWLRILYRLEEIFPHYFGENGKYPLIVIRKV